MPRIDREANAIIRFARHVDASLDRAANVPEIRELRSKLAQGESAVRIAVKNSRNVVDEVRRADKERFAAQRRVRECGRGVLILARRVVKSREAVPDEQDFRSSPLRACRELADALRRVPGFVAGAHGLDGLADELQDAEAKAKASRDRRKKALMSQAGAEGGHRHGAVPHPVEVGTWFARRPTPRQMVRTEKEGEANRSGRLN